MNKLLYIIFMVFVTLFLTACGSTSSATPSTDDNKKEDIEKLKQTSAGGAGMKGPFKKGSLVVAYKLNDNGTRTSTSDKTTTTDNLGNYALSKIHWNGATEIVISGIYFDENSANWTTKTSALSTIVNVMSKDTIHANINVLTNLEASRIKNLMHSNVPIKNAKEQAKKEVISLFDISLSKNVNLEDLDLTDGSGTNADANSKLLRISAAISAKPEILKDLEKAISDGNLTNDSEGSVALASLTREIKDINISEISKNLTDGLGITNPPNKDDSDDNPTLLKNSYPPIITSGEGKTTHELEISENSIEIMQITANDEDGDTVSYTIEGSDKNDFSIDSVTGILSFKTAPNFETKQSYVVEVIASDGLYIDTQTITINIVNLNDNEPILFDGKSKTVTVNENQTAIITVTATDADSNDLQFSISDNDADALSIDAYTGVLRFKKATDYETKNSYIVDVKVDDGTYHDTQTLTINIKNINDIPEIENISDKTAMEGSLFSVIPSTDDDDGDTLTFSITNKPTWANFDTATGKISGTPSNKDVGDTNGTVISITDGHSTIIHTQPFNITVSNLNNPPVANSLHYDINQNNSKDIDLMKNISDPDSIFDSYVNPTITQTQPSHGEIIELGNGVIRYTPTTGYSGSDSFTYRVTDSGGIYATATVTLTIIEEVTHPKSTGQAIAPYISGATFWADLNRNNLYDSLEPLSTLSDEEGRFSFSSLVEEGTPILMLTSGLSNGKIFDGNLSANFDTSNGGIISPLTSLIHLGFQKNDITSYFGGAGLSGLNEDELYLDPFSTSLLPTDGNLSSYSDDAIEKFRRVLIANVVINNTLTMGVDGYHLDKLDIQNKLFNGGSDAPLGILVNLSNQILTVETLKQSNAKSMAKIYISIVNHVRDILKNDTENIATTYKTFMKSTTVSDLVEKLKTSYKKSLEAGLANPKFALVEKSSTNFMPLLMVNTNDLGVKDIKIVYDNLSITFATNNHNYYEGDTLLGQWQIVDGKLQANEKEFDLKGKILAKDGINYDIKKVYYDDMDFLEKESSTIEFYENLSSNSILKQFSVDECNKFNSISLSGIGADNFQVSLDGNLTIAQGVTIDYESTPSFQLHLDAIDCNSNDISRDINLTILDVDEIHHRGIHVGGNFGTTVILDITNSAPTDKYFSYLKELNINWVNLIEFLTIENSLDATVEKTPNPDVTDMQYYYNRLASFHDITLRKIIRAFKEHGINVTLTTVMEDNIVGEKGKTWHRSALGNPNTAHLEWIDDFNATNWPWRVDHPNHEAYVSEFWRTYTASVTKLATLAEEEGVSMFSVGAEMDGLFRTRSDDENWPNNFKDEIQTLVTSVKTVYNGKVGYQMHSGAIQDSYLKVGSGHLWDDIEGFDYIGLSSYFQMTNSLPTEVISVEDFETKWDEIFTNYFQPLNTFGLPIYIMETGYTTAIGGVYDMGSHLWEDKVFSDNNGNGLDDGEEQARNVIKALYNVEKQRADILNGIFIYSTTLADDDQILKQGWYGKVDVDFRGELLEEYLKEEFNSE